MKSIFTTFIMLAISSAAHGSWKDEILIHCGGLSWRGFEISREIEEKYPHKYNGLHFKLNYFASTKANEKTERIVNFYRRNTNFNYSSKYVFSFVYKHPVDGNFIRITSTGWGTAVVQIDFNDSEGKFVNVDENGHSCFVNEKVAAAVLKETSH